MARPGFRSRYLPHRHHRDYMQMPDGRMVPGWRWQWVKLFRTVISELSA